MRHLPVILLVLAVPVAVAGYLAGAAVLGALPLPGSIRDFLVSFGPLLVAGLCTVPFLVPFFDRMAKRDLAAAPGRGASSDAETDVARDRRRPATKGRRGR